MTPGGMPSPPHREVGDLRPFLVEGDWEMILNAMVWTEGMIFNLNKGKNTVRPVRRQSEIEILGPGWWNGKLVFSDTRLGKVFSWDPKTQLVGVEVELAGNDDGNTGVWMEPFSNGLKYNPLTDELLICEHGNRGISGSDKIFKSDQSQRQTQTQYLATDSETQSVRV